MKLFQIRTSDSGDAISNISYLRGMSLKFVDNLSTAQHKHLLVSTAISLYSVMYQEYMWEK